jgi:hypothetical protein
LVVLLHLEKVVQLEVQFQEASIASCGVRVVWSVSVLSRFSKPGSSNHQGGEEEEEVQTYPYNATR